MCSGDRDLVSASRRTCWRPESVPAQDGIGCHDAGDLRETLPPEGLPFYGEPAPLVVGEANALGAVCRTEDPVLLPQVLDDVLLLSIDPA